MKTLKMWMYERNQAARYLQYVDEKLREVEDWMKFDSTAELRQYRRELEADRKEVACRIDSIDYTLAEMQWEGITA